MESESNTQVFRRRIREYRRADSRVTVGQPDSQHACIIHIPGISGVFTK